MSTLSGCATTRIKDAGNGKKPSRTGGSTNFVKVTTDHVDLNAEKNKLKKENPGFNVNVLTPKQYRKFKTGFDEPRTVRGRGERPERKQIPRSLRKPPQEGSLRKKIKKFAGGGMSQRGLGRAFMKGGKV